jgi:AhpC/TSA family/Thiol:disulfide interchange protein DsbD, N-terminal
VELEQSRVMLEENGVRIAAVSYDSQEILAAFALKHSIGFPLLSDKGSETIRRFGIFNHNMAPDLRSYGVPHPVDYLVAPDGTMAKKYFVPNYQHRVTGSAVALREFGTVSQEAPSVTLEAGALAVQIGFPSAKAFAGQEVSFFAHFVLQPGWHIYGSPLPESYTTTSITFEGPSVLAQKLELPEAGMLHIPALGETLPVYSGSFKGVGSLLLKHPLPEGRLDLRGRLEFQQCSDAVCEPPQAIPFGLALILEPFMVSERDKKLMEKQKKE